MSDSGSPTAGEDVPETNTETHLSITKDEPTMLHAPSPQPYQESYQNMPSPQLQGSYQYQQQQQQQQQQPPPSEPRNEYMHYIHDRDPKNINEDVKVEFDDLFAEPDGYHSFDGVWATSYTVFTETKSWCYRILSAIFAIPCAFCWGLNFACLAFNYIWTVKPYLRAFSIEIKPLAKVWAICIGAFCDPLYESIALLFSKIKLSLKKD